MTRPELRSAARKQQFGSLAEVEAIVLESNGESSVIRSIDDGSAFGEALEAYLSE